jgi:hypothetical protein
MTEKDLVIETFFGYQDGELPEEYIPLKDQYLKDKSLISGCSHCNLTTLMTTYRNKIIAGKLS